MKISCYNEPGNLRGIFCVKHKSAGMVNVKATKCIWKSEDGSGLTCDKQPAFNEPGKSTAIFCAKHASAGMEDIKSARCKTLNCTTRVSAKKYSGYCYRCFIYEFPDNKVVRNHKTRERAVADFVRASYPDLTITFDRPVADGCSRRRPDILMDMGEYVVITEIDENQHQAYDCSCENKRLMQLFQDCGNRPLVMVRFNPDRYYDQRERPIASCWGYTKEKGLCVVKPNKAAEWAARLATLKTTLDLVFSQPPTKEVDAILLYYDGF